MNAEPSCELIHKIYIWKGKITLNRTWTYKKIDNTDFNSEISKTKSKLFRDHSFSTCAKFPEKLTCLTLWYPFGYVLNNWSFIAVFIWRNPLTNQKILIILLRYDITWTLGGIFFAWLCSTSKMSCRPLQSSHHLRCESTDWFLYDGRIFITFFEVLQRDVNNC